MAKVKVSKDFLNLLKKYNIFQVRSGMAGGVPDYINRFKEGDYVHFADDIILEEFTTFAFGNTLFSSGAFSSLASTLPLGSTVGRYVSFGDNGQPVGFRHPIQAVGMNSAFFNFARENVHSYFVRYENNFGRVNKKPVSVPQPQRAPIIVGNDVWIGSGVTIFGGVKIGSGAVIASRSVVTKDVKPYSIVAGIPASHRKWRFTEDIIQRLLSSQWWDYELGDMYKSELDFSDPTVFLNAFEPIKHKLRKLNVKKTPLLLYSIFGNKNILLDFFGRVICLQNINNNLTLVKSPVKSIKLKELLPLEVKYRNDKEGFLYNETLGYIEINKDLTISTLESPIEAISKLVFNQDKTELSIQYDEHKYLSSSRNEDFTLQPHNREWETFNTPLSLE